MALELYDLEKAAFEVRFKRAFLHWDRAGRFWNRMLRDFPDLENSTGEPGRTVFLLRRDYQLTLQLESANIMADEPGNLDELSLLAERVTTAVNEEFEVADYVRIGLRMTFFRSLASQVDAAKAVAAFGLLRIPHGRYFDVSEQPTNLSYIARWDGKPFGALVQVNSDGRKIELKPPFGMKEIKPYNEVRHGATVDVDYYSTQALPTSQLKASEWIKQAEHMIRRDTDRILESPKA